VDYLGIDVGKSQLHAELLQDNSTARKTVPNTVKGFEQLSKWLSNRKAPDVHVCLEATGSYGEAVAEYLFDAGHRVSVVNPMQIKAFGRSLLVRTKTDTVDAGVIAQFCRERKPAPWAPPSREMRAFRALLRRRETLSNMIAAEKNRLEAAVEPHVQRSIASTISALQDELKRLEGDIDTHIDGNPKLREMIDRLDEIPGFGKLTAEKVIAETNGFSVCDRAEAIIAYAGLNPQHYQSGSTLRRRGISKIGNAALRKALYHAALSAKTHSLYFRPFVERLKAAGKPPKVIIVALMRKLLVLAHTLVTHETRFDPALSA
jgi:transposase